MQCVYDFLKSLKNNLKKSAFWHSYLLLVADYFVAQYTCFINILINILKNSFVKANIL